MLGSITRCAPSNGMGEEPTGNKKNKKDDWTRDEWGNHIADRLAGACPKEVSEITNGRSVHFKVSARDALRSLLSPHQWYRDPIRNSV